jgi:glycosyltransferase involved in cell wall biosynthesis/O-antigen/teichoic acid export membrane protein
MSETPETGSAATSGATPAISVFLPCYNAHRDLPRALDSVRAQTFQDIEIIVVDDGSTDPDTIRFLDSLPDDIRLIRQENRGLPGARNTGFRNARGTWVLPLDCDDWIAPTFLEQAKARLEAAPFPAFAFANITMFGDTQGVLRKNFNYFEQLFFNQLPYCMLIPRALWVAVDGYDESMRDGYEDWEFNIKLANHGAAGLLIEEPLFNYNVSASGMLSKTSRRQHGRLWRAIRERHTDTYRLSSLVRLWREWRLRPVTRPPALYFLWNVLFTILPVDCVSMIAGQAFRLSHSRRAARVERALLAPAFERKVRLGPAPPTRDLSAWLISRAGIFTTLIPAILSRGANYLILIIAAWTLSADEFGIFATLWVVGSLAGAVVSGGGDMWLNRFSTPHLTHELRVPSIWLFYLSMSIALALIAGAAGLIATTMVPALKVHAATVLLAILAFCAMGVGESALALLRASGRVSQFFAIRDLVAPLIFLAIVLLLLPEQAITIFAVFGGVWLTIAVIIIGWLILGDSTRTPRPAWRPQLVKSLLRHTGLMVMSNLSSRGLAYFDVLILTGFISLSEIGQYRVAAQFAIGFIVVQRFVFLSLPWQLRATGTEDVRRVARHRAAEQQRTLVLLSGVALALSVVLAGPLLSLFGERFVDATQFLQVLLIIRFTDLLWGPQHEVLISNGLVRDDALANVAGIGALTVVFWLALFEFDPVWAAVIAVAAGGVAAQGSRAFMICRKSLYCPRLLA